MEKQSILTFLPWTILMILAFLVLRPVPIPTEKNCETVEGTVLSVFEGGVKDVCFQLVGVDRTFYINRGLEQGLDIGDLRERLMGQPVTIRYPRYWTPLDPKSRTRHLGEVSMNGKIIYSELE